MLLIMGVDSVESSSSTKAAKNSIDRGVAGRNMLAKNSEVYAVIRLARDRLSRLGRRGVVLGDGRPFCERDVGECAVVEAVGAVVNGLKRAS
jgi:hypothetical protein